jgi:hypothetical protein
MGSRYEFQYELLYLCMFVIILLNQLSMPTSSVNMQQLTDPVPTDIIILPGDFVELSYVDLLADFGLDS